MFRLIVWILYVHSTFSINYDSNDIETVVEWRRIQFAYANEKARKNDIAAGTFNPDVPIPIDVEVYHRQEFKKPMLFVTIPKFQPGVPVTLGYVTDRKYEGDPEIAPFPSWSWHRNTSQCHNKLVSVFRVKLDRCGLLHVLDSGNEGNGVICPPKVVTFDLSLFPEVKRPIFTISLAQSMYRNNSIFVTPIIQNYGDDCLDGINFYLADTARHRLVVVSRHFGRVYSHKVMQPEAEFSNFDILGDRFFLDDGIMGMDLSPEKNAYDNNRILVFSALASSHAAALDVASLFDDGFPKFINYPTPRRSQSAAMAVSKTGVAFFGDMSNASITCWNTKSWDYGKFIHTIYRDTVTMQFASGVKVVENLAGEEQLWLMTNRFQKGASTGYNFNEINFRISMGNINKLLKGSKC